MRITSTLFAAAVVAMFGASAISAPPPAPAAPPTPTPPATVINNSVNVSVTTANPAPHHKKRRRHRHHHHCKHQSVATVYYHVPTVYRTIATYRHVEFMPHHVVAHPPTPKPTPAHSTSTHNKK